MDANISQVFELVEEAKDSDAIELAKTCVATVLGYILSEKDRTEFLKLEKVLDGVTADIQLIQQILDRNLFQEKTLKILEKYQSEEYDYDFQPIIQECIEESRRKLDEKDLEWRKTNVTLGDRSRKAVHEWKQRIEVLPSYLSDETAVLVRELDKEADKLISDGKIEDVILYFKRLTNTEKEECMKVLASLIQL